jgi:tetratricopeptide (TPR) repeat protein
MTLDNSWMRGPLSIYGKSRGFVAFLMVRTRAALGLKENVSLRRYWPLRYGGLPTLPELELLGRRAVRRWPGLRPYLRFGYVSIRGAYRLSGARYLRRRLSASSAPIPESGIAVSGMNALATDTLKNISSQAQNLFHSIMLYRAHGASAGGDTRILCDYFSALMLSVFLALDAMFAEQARRFGASTDLPGQLLLRAGAPDLAIHQAALRYLDDILSEKPNFGEARLARARLLRLAGRLDEAVVDFRLATAQRPILSIARYDFSHVVHAHYECGLVLEELGRDEEALSELTCAHRIAQEFSAAWRKAAEILHRRGAHRDAASCQERALQFFPCIPTLPALPRIAGPAPASS